MRLVRLECEGYRGLSKVSINFDKRLTVLVGTNGSGKSSILDALTVLLSQYSARLASSPSSAGRLKDTDVRLGASETTLRLKAFDDRVGPVAWALRKQGQRERVLRPTGSDLTGLNSFIKAIAADQSDGLDYLRGETLPIYYDQSRSVIRIPKRRRDKTNDTALATFQDGISSWGIDFRKLTYWFQDRETDELRRQKARSRYVDHQLEAVRQAITKATGLKTPFFNVDAPRGITVMKGRTPLHISQLSTGEQVLMALGADLARRLSNIAADRDRPLSGSAIVLIDEVELHLHPKWQRHFIPWLLSTFPKCQFVLTTHSPQVLGSVHASCVRVLASSARGTKVQRTSAVFGRDSNHLLRSVFDSDERRAKTHKLIEDADRAITVGDYSKAQALLEAMRDEIEGSPPEVAVLRARLNRRTRTPL
ncbi:MULTISPECIES: AAA family ATPase [unclassified Mesorhizobium]|uniref:AAA family ATPase n=1 Tax=unclassified Mesorhizobium TaxID=325217 RepID=UPI003339D950